MKFPIIIGSNCSGANFYHNYLNIPFYSPFIWSVVPYKSLFILLTEWPNINWFSYKLIDNPNKELTYTLVIDKKIEIHFVHYFYSNKFIEPFYKGASVFSSNIKNFIIKKYTERTNRMFKYADINNPYFIIHQEDSLKTNDLSSLIDICKLDSNYKRVIINDKLKNTKYNKNVLIINEKKLLPQNSIEKNGRVIEAFFNIDPNIKNINSVSLNNSTNHQ